MADVKLDEKGLEAAAIVVQDENRTPEYAMGYAEALLEIIRDGNCDPSKDMHMVEYAIAHLQAAGAAAPAPSAPAGWKMVPVEPTREMWAAMGDALVRCGHIHHDKLAEAAWSAGIAAAPSPGDRT